MTIIILMAYSCQGPKTGSKEEVLIDSVNVVSLPAPMPEPSELMDTITHDTITIKYKDTISDEARKSMEISPLDTTPAVIHVKKSLYKLRRQQKELDSLLNNKRRR